MRKFLFLLLPVFLLFINEIYSQNGWGNPELLETITVSGTAVVDSGYLPGSYYIDEANNSSLDYYLYFGPDWYTPDNNAAELPVNGDTLFITGGLIDSTLYGPAIIVYEINHQLWRDPFNPFWNHMGDKRGGGRLDSCFNSGFGWMHAPPSLHTVSGSILVDSTFNYWNYYLDENADSKPDYFLNFGPPWYTPSSGLTRPVDNEQVSVTGGIIRHAGSAMLIVYQINGEDWIDSTHFSGFVGGGWIRKNMMETSNFSNPFDDMDWIRFQPGWHNMGGGHHGAMQDSLFCRILEIFPQRINTLENKNAFAGFEIDFFYPGSMGEGMRGFGCGEHFQFSNDVTIQFHYTDTQLEMHNIEEQSLQVSFWNSDINEWEVVSGAQVNVVGNLVTLASSIVSNFYILSGSSPTDVSDDELIVDEFSLGQNYPNPFNPNTIIKWQVPAAGNVKLVVFDILGNEVVTLINKYVQAGSYETGFDAGQLSSGTYFYQLQTGGFTQTRKMILLK